MINYDHKVPCKLIFVENAIKIVIKRPINTLQNVLIFNRLFTTKHNPMECTTNILGIDTVLRLLSMNSKDSTCKNVVEDFLRSMK